MKLTNKEAIEVIKSNYPPSRYSTLRVALNHAIEVLKTLPEPNTRDMFDFIRVNALRNLNDEQRNALALNMLNAVEVEWSKNAHPNNPDKFKLYAIPKEQEDE